MSHFFPKTIRLRKRVEYRRMSHSSAQYLGAFILIDCRENHLEQTRLGLTVTCRYGDAHQRNRFKRLVREAFRLNFAHLRQGLDLNIKPRSKAKSARQQDITRELLRFLQVDP